MKYKPSLYLIILLVCVISSAQNNHILFGFDELPQTLMLNPGAEVNYYNHVGVPFLSNIFIQGGATNSGVTFNSVSNGVEGSMVERLSTLLYNLDSIGVNNKDYFQGNQRLEVIQIGFRLKDPKNYLSIGYYQEIDGFSTYPKEFASLYLHGDFDKDGEPVNNIPVGFDKLNVIADLIGVLHIGLSKEINDKWTIGGRLKLISGSLSLESSDNTGEYNFDGVQTHGFYGVDLIINNSGLIDKDGNDVFTPVRENLNGLIFTKGNFGLGLDLGLTYHIKDNLTLTASVLDLDYVTYSEENTTFNINGDFDFADIDGFSPPEGDEINYWIDKLETTINYRTSIADFNMIHSPKVHTSISYDLIHRGSTRAKGTSIFRNVSCEEVVRDKELKTEFGLHTFTVFRPNTMVWAVSPFVSHDFNKYLAAKLTYNYDQFSYTNFGLGISTHYKMLNFYATADNLLDLPKLKDTNYTSLQFGMNLIFN